MVSPGEEKAWEILTGLDPAVVCQNGSVVFSEKLRQYTVRSLCTDFSILLDKKLIISNDPAGEFLIKKHGYFFVHSCLWYLIHAKDVPCTGKFIKPRDIRGGDIFFRGSHVLPLENLAKKYGNDKEAFIKKSSELCAETVPYGDVAVKLFPMPKIPVILILWLNDEEFAARADLLFDSSCELHLPLDILWSLAMLGVLVLL
jgi:hypothetical protein